MDFVAAAFATVIRFVFDVLIEGAAYWTARIVVPIVTVGAVKIERLADGSGGYGAKRGEDGAVVLGADLAALVGLILWAVSIGGAVAISQASP